VKVRYTPPALADLEAILNYVTEQSPQGANRIKARIQAIERLLAQHPLSGVRTRLPWLPRISVSPYPYLIFYEVADSEVIVHAVRHGARAPPSMPGSAG
jgi:addiction module RelE/StbE family toxin